MFKIPRKMYKLLTQMTDLFIHQPKYPLDMFFKRGKKKKHFSTAPYETYLLLHCFLLQ